MCFFWRAQLLHAQTLKETYIYTPSGSLLVPWSFVNPVAEFLKVSFLSQGKGRDTYSGAWQRSAEV